MKYEVQGQYIMATPASLEEAMTLIEYLNSFKSESKTVERAVRPYHRKKPLHQKECRLCQKTFKGKQGLAVHQARFHMGRNHNNKGEPIPSKGSILDKVLPTIKQAHATT